MSGTTQSKASAQRYIVSAATSPNHTVSCGVKLSPANSSIATSPPPFKFSEFTIGTGVTGDLEKQIPSNPTSPSQSVVYFTWLVPFLRKTDIQLCQWIWSSNRHRHWSFLCLVLSDMVSPGIEWSSLAIDTGTYVPCPSYKKHICAAVTQDHPLPVEPFACPPYEWRAAAKPCRLRNTLASP